MKEVECGNCGAVNLVDSLADDFKCGKCSEHSNGMEFSDLYDIYQNELQISAQLRVANDQIADRLRTRDREVERLTKLLIDNNIETDYDMELCVQNEEIKILEEALGFYAEEDNWIEHDRGIHFVSIEDSDASRNGGCGCKPVCQCPYYGGKRARQALEKLKEIRKTK